MESKTLVILKLYTSLLNFLQFVFFLKVNVDYIFCFVYRMDENAVAGSSTEGASKSVGLERARRMALQHIETFVLTFADPQAFSAAALSSAPAPLAQVTESARILEAGHLRCRYSNTYMSTCMPCIYQVY